METCSPLLFRLQPTDSGVERDNHMSGIARRVLAVLIGAAVALAVVSLGDFVAGRMWSPSPDTDLSTAGGLSAAMASIPTRALMVLVFGWVAAAAAGAFVATRLSPGRGQASGLIVTALLLVATIVNLLSIPHPVWVWVAAIMLMPAAGWLAARAAATNSTAATR